MVVATAVVPSERSERSGIHVPPLIRPVRSTSAASSRPSSSRSARSAIDSARLPWIAPRCDKCSSVISLTATTHTAVIYLNNCTHIVCQTCLNGHVSSSANSPHATQASITCPVEGCECVLSPMEIQTCLGKEGFEELLGKEIKSAAQQVGSTIVPCPKCGTFIERVVSHAPMPPPARVGGRFRSNSNGRQRRASNAGVDGGPNVGGSKFRYNLIGFLKEKMGRGCCVIEGKVVSEAAYRHHQSWRLRCAHCEENFCAGCAVAPYHAGFTCDQYKARLSAQRCRYCEGIIQTSKRKSNARATVCNAEDCVDRANRACDGKLECGHACCGVKGERNCLPCLEENCPGGDGSNDGTSWCAICFTETLSAAPSIKLQCGHVFHSHCVDSKLDSKWPGARMSFNFLNCPTCSTEMSHPHIQAKMDKMKRLQEDVRRRAVMRLTLEKLDNAPELVDPDSRFFDKPALFAEHKLCYYMCSKCSKPYFGGLRNCEDMREEGEAKSEDLVCGPCVPRIEAKPCPKHGMEYIEYKCKFCCRVASYFCWGNTHFCSECHTLQEGGDYLTRKRQEDLPHCDGSSSCPLRVEHPPNGVEFVLGCALCRDKENCKTQGKKNNAGNAAQTTTA